MYRKTLLGAALALMLGTGSALATTPLSSADVPANSMPPVFQHIPGADDVAARPGETQATSRYLFVPAAAFTRRDSTDSLVNDGTGCTSTDGWALNADLQLPEGALVDGIRVFYHVPTTGTVTSWFTRYDGAGGFSDLITTNTTNSGGYFSEYFPAAAPIPIDPFVSSYSLVSRQNGTDVQVCGIRVFYSY